MNPKKTDGPCDRCSRGGYIQPSDGDAAMLYRAAHGDVTGDDVVLCRSCVRTLEGMSERAAGMHLQRVHL